MYFLYYQHGECLYLPDNVDFQSARDAVKRMYMHGECEPFVAVSGAAPFQNELYAYCIAMSEGLTLYALCKVVYPDHSYDMNWVRLGIPCSESFTL